MKQHLRVCMLAIVCVALLATAGCGGNGTGTTHISYISSVTGPFSGRIDPAYSYMAISAGYEHTCGLDTSGHAYCW
jgi:hypothetical protein